MAKSKETGGKGADTRSQAIRDGLERSRELGKRYEQINREKAAIKDRAGGVYNTQTPKKK